MKFIKTWMLFAVIIFACLYVYRWLTGPLPDLPPGYTLVCDGRGNYTCRKPSGFVLSLLDSRSKRKAIMNGWYYYTKYDFEATNIWKECP